MAFGEPHNRIEVRKQSGGRQTGKPRLYRQSVRRRVLFSLGVMICVSGWSWGQEKDLAKPEETILRGTASSAPVSEGLKERSRRVLVVYGWDVAEAEKPTMLPVDTMTGDLLQAPLEWLGYEADYLDIGEKALPEDVGQRYAAVFLDGEMSVPLAKEKPLVEWLLRLKDAGVPLLFLGEQPIRSDEARMILGRGLGLKGSLEPVVRVEKIAVTVTNAADLADEIKVTPRATAFLHLSAPDRAKVILGLQGRGPDGELVRFDPVFLAEWGGMWLEPYVVFRGSSDSNLFYGDPYVILAEVLNKSGPMPVPDVTTRDGRRLFYSHIDGDGFATPSSFKGHPLCAELIRDRILKVFPFPITVSVIESEIRAQAAGYPTEQANRFADMARSIFALPNVQPASHSFSHPYQWDPKDPNPGIYTEPHMPLRPEIDYPVVDSVREIKGSIDYINETLLPKGKKVELMLWSGNCRPGEQALRVCRELGVENMNGGNTIVGRRYPGMAGIAARVMPWGDELQIHAANQNEFMYANGWTGPFFGGFADVIDTFERTDSQRRTKPVNVYYHFYSATSLSSLRALEKIHHWCAENDLHSVTALDYARIAKDAWRTRVFEKGPRHWVISNRGDLRTYRVPSGHGLPDLEKCIGVTGYTEHLGEIYLSTNGAPQIEIALGDGPAVPVKAEDVFLRLASSTGEIRFLEQSALRCAFRVRDLRKIKTEIAGLRPGTACEVTINAVTSRRTADQNGHLLLELPADAEVTVDATRSQYAILR
jgi:polysaccharide biosynthesis protein PelA